MGITPDGPKGPIFGVADGIVAISQKTKTKILPFSSIPSTYWQMKSWDRFMLPKPFGRIDIMVSPPLEIAIPPANNEEEVKLLSDYMSHYQGAVDRMTGKI